ncbi:MAG: helicase [Rhodospirillales bacterium 20-64-7]|nr:MAG: helicase [Rhodospirillales bacterium 20-64-7]
MSFPVQNIALARALADRGYMEPTEVQRAVLSPEAEDRDLLVSAQTGSGKTIAYGLAMASTILGLSEFLPATQEPLVLVIAPTRELALQVHAELSWLYAPAGGRIVACVGGMDARREQRQLNAGCHMVVGTPGRLQDHINRGNLNLSACEVVVLDEADEMLDLGFKDELDFILGAAPESRRTLLFSATIAKEIAALARQYQNHALRIDTVARNAPHSDIEFRAVAVGGHEIEVGLVNLLRHHGTRALIFCATRDSVRHLHASLLARGFNAVALSGELSQAERNAALAALRDGRAQVCIATDVAARGLDLPDLDLVIHADLPTNRATLLHRSGRTGRAGRKGLCLLLVPASKRRRAELLLGSANISLTWQAAPTAEEVRRRDQERLLEDPLLTQVPAGDELALAQALLERQTPEAIAAALIRLYRSHLPEPAELAAQALPAPMPSRARPASASPDRPMAWFRAPVGRKQNADPKWLIPLICKQGGITKQEIGVIRIFDRETKFEITADAAERFAAAITGAHGSELTIEPSTPPSPGAARGPASAAKPYSPKPARAARSPTNAPGNPPASKPNEQARRRLNKARRGQS